MITTAIDPPRAGRPRLLRALSHRNYRLFFLGNGISLVGNWMTNIAMAWLVYRLAGGHENPLAAAWLGYVAFASQAPTFLFSAICGVFCDRHDRRSILVFTQALSALQSAALAWLIFSGHATPDAKWLVLLLAFAQGLINSLDIPARQSFVVEMVEDRNDVSNAIALNSMMFNSARLVGPAAGGLLIAWIGEGWCFAIDAVSYIAVIVSLLAMRITPVVRPAARASVWASLREGAVYVFGFAPVRTLIALLAVGSFVGAALPTLLPLIADRLSDGHGAAMLGWLSSAVGVGALCSAVYLASRTTVVGLGRVISIAGIAYSIALTCFAFAPTLWLAVPMLMCVGASFMALFAGSNTMLQSMVDDHLRGRLMSFFSMAVMGMAPFGALAAGWMASHATPRVVLLCAALVAFTMTAVFAWQLPGLRVLIRPVYVRKGILREAAQGVEQQSVARVDSGAVA